MWKKVIGSGWILMVSCCLVLSVSKAEEESRVRKASRSTLDGMWTIVREVAGGEDQVVTPLRLTINGNVWEWQYPIEDRFGDIGLRGKDVIFTQPVLYDTDAKPPEVDLLPEGFLRTDKGDLIPTAKSHNPTSGIFRLRGELLDICVGDEYITIAGTKYERPDSFTADKGEKRILRTFRRVSARRALDVSAAPLGADQPLRTQIGKLQIKGGKVTIREDGISIEGGNVEIQFHE